MQSAVISHQSAERAVPSTFFVIGLDSIEAHMFRSAFSYKLQLTQVLMTSRYRNGAPFPVNIVLVPKK
jgi:hypothetical protein